MKTVWKDQIQIQADLERRFDLTGFEKISSLYALHFFLHGALPKPNFTFQCGFEDVIAISEYAKNLLSNVSTSYTNTDVAVACMLLFFHRDFLVDVQNSDPSRAMKLLERELISGSLRHPYRFGRILYDKFNDIPSDSLVDHLLPADVDMLLQGTEQGLYQVGRFVTGPLGIVESEEPRFVPPLRAVPLWHCADPGCQKLHSVSLLGHQNSAYSLAKEIKDAAAKLEGRPSDWEGTISRIDPHTSSVRGKEYYDITVLIAEAMSSAERAELFVCAFGIHEKSHST